MIVMPPDGQSIHDEVHDILDSYYPSSGLDLGDVAQNAMTGTNDNTSANKLPNLDDLSGVVDSSAVADIDWAKELERLYPLMDKWIQAEMDYNNESMERSMLFNAEQAEIERRYNSAEAAKQREWQEKLSNTQYQRAVADMRAAGLNPILLAAKASGAVTPTGGMASSTSARSAGNSSVNGLNNHLPNLLASIAAMIGSVGSLLDISNVFGTKKVYGSGTMQQIGFR